MNDENIIELYFSRSEEAIALTQEKYGSYCRYIAKNILGSDEEARQIENDTYLKIWNTVPPNRPSSLKAYAGMVCRTLSINEYNRYEAKKRKSHGNTVLDELIECIPDKNSDGFAEAFELREAMGSFIGSLADEKQDIFLKRYFYAMPISDIATDLGKGKSYVKMTLFRIRKELKEYLSKEGIEL